jgi:hypothetical protein
MHANETEKEPRTADAWSPPAGSGAAHPRPSEACHPTRVKVEYTLTTISWVTIVTNGGGPVTIGAVVLLILRGRLISRKQADELIQVYKDSSNTWRDAYQKEAAARKDQEAALQETLELSRAANKALQALRDEGDKNATTSTV